jgi:hypothetical protein
MMAVILDYDKILSSLQIYMFVENEDLIIELLFSLLRTHTFCVVLDPTIFAPRLI